MSVIRKINNMENHNFAVDNQYTLLCLCVIYKNIWGAVIM